MPMEPWLPSGIFEITLAQRKRPGIYTALLLMLLTAVLFVAAIVLIDVRYSAGSSEPPAPLPSLWPEGSYTTPQSYEVWGSDGSYSAAQLPGKWRYDVAGTIQQLGDGRYLWDTRGPGMYWAIPYASSVAAGEVTEVPHLQDGRPSTMSDDLPSTRLAISVLGPTTPDQLMRIVEAARRDRGEWSLRSSQFLGRGVTILEVHGTSPANHHSEGGPYSTTLWIDDQFLFVLKSESSGIIGEFSTEAVRVQFDSPIPQDVFEFLPPPGFKHCLPPQFADRGPGC